MVSLADPRATGYNNSYVVFARVWPLLHFFISTHYIVDALTIPIRQLAYVSAAQEVRRGTGGMSGLRARIFVLLGHSVTRRRCNISTSTCETGYLGQASRRAFILATFKGRRGAGGCHPWLFALASNHQNDEKKRWYTTKSKGCRLYGSNATPSIR